MESIVIVFCQNISFLYFHTAFHSFVSQKKMLCERNFNNEGLVHQDDLQGQKRPTGFSVLIKMDFKTGWQALKRSHLIWGANDFCLHNQISPQPSTCSNNWHLKNYKHINSFFLCLLYQCVVLYAARIVCVSQKEWMDIIKRKNEPVPAGSPSLSKAGLC